MRDRQIVGVLSACVAAGYVVIGAFHFALPNSQLSFSASLFASLAHDGSATFSFHYWALAITSLLAIGLVLGLQPEAPSLPALLLQCSRAWALLGFSVTAVDFLYVEHRALLISKHWDSLDSSAQAALLALGIGHLDPLRFMGFGIVGPWPVLLGVTALRTAAWPRVVCWLSFGVGIAAIFVCVGSLTGIFAFVNIAAAAGGLFLIPSGSAVSRLSTFAQAVPPRGGMPVTHSRSGSRPGGAVEGGAVKGGFADHRLIEAEIRGHRRDRPGFSHAEISRLGAVIPEGARSVYAGLRA